MKGCRCLIEKTVSVLEPKGRQYNQPCTVDWLSVLLCACSADKWSDNSDPWGPNCPARPCKLTPTPRVADGPPLLYCLYPEGRGKGKRTAHPYTCALQLQVEQGGKKDEPCSLLLVEGLEEAWHSPLHVLQPEWGTRK